MKSQSLVISSIVALIGVTLYVTIKNDYFHLLSELFIVMISFTIGVITLNTRKVLKDQRLVFIGISLLFFVVFNVLHILLYTEDTLFELSEQYHFIGLLYVSFIVFIGLFYIKKDKELNIYNALIIQIFITSVILYVFSSTNIISNPLSSQDAKLFRLVFIALISLVNIVNIIIVFVNSKFKTVLSKELLLLLSFMLFIALFSYFNIIFNETIAHIFKLLFVIMLHYVISDQGIKKPYSNALEQLERQKDELQRLNKIDLLTGIPNRSYLLENVDKTFRFSKREKQTIVILMIDIDDFSQYNINFGHTHGDSILKRIASVIKRECKRPLDFVGRYGGEEFLAVLPNSDFEAGRIISERLMKAIRELRIVHYKDEHEFLTVSIGYVSLSPQQETVLDYPLKEVDNQVGKVKSLGKNSYIGLDLDKGEQS